MDLPSFIRSLGVDKFAAEFDEKPRTVRAWRDRERHPHKKTAQKIVDRSQGRVSFADIYGTPHA